MLSEIPLFDTRYASGWPTKPDNEVGVFYASVAEILAAHEPTDAHFAAYSVPSITRRLDVDAPARLGRVPMVLAVFDVDGPDHTCADAWWTTEKEKVAALTAEHAGAFVYRTRGGYRIVYGLSRPIYIDDARDAAAWHALYVAWLHYLGRRFGIVGDHKCKGWQWLYRIPHATRDNAQTPEELETLGDASAIGIWSPDLSDADMTQAPEQTQTQIDHYAESPVDTQWAQMTAETRAAQLDKARRLAAGHPPAISGQDGHGTTIRLAGLICRGCALPPHEAVEVLRDVYNPRCQPPWSDAELRHKVEDATRNSPIPLNRDVLTWQAFLAQRTKSTTPQPDADGEVESVDDAAIALNTDLSNAVRFADHHGDRFRYLTDREVWIHWTDGRWKHATRTEMMKAAKQTARRMLGEAMRSGYDEAAIKFAIKTASARSISAMIDLAASEPTFRAEQCDLDRHLDFLTVANGTIHLRTGELRNHAREDLLTTLTPIEYDAAATCPRWEQFLREVFDDDADLVAFIQRAVGYSLTGHTREHAFFVLHGSGKNGKGRFVRQLMALLGDAARTTSFSTFTAGRFSDSNANTPALAALAGARLVVAGEPDDGVRLSESVIKQLTGEDEIMACAKYEHPFTYTPRFKIWLHTNHRPEIRGTDEGIWRRPRLVPFNVTFDGNAGRPAADPRLDEKLDGEREGILAWAVRGAIDWHRVGLGESRAVAQATATYREESDPLGDFIEEWLVRGEGEFAPHAELYARYREWCQRRGDDPWTGQRLSKRLVALGFRTGKKDHARGFHGVAVRKLGTAFLPSTK